jgi:hypothetical protein
MAFLSYASNITSRFLGRYNRAATTKRIWTTVRHFLFNITLLYIIGCSPLPATTLSTLVVLRQL